MVDPANSLTALSAQDIDTWLYDPSVVDPTTNPPGNDILCLAFANPLYEIPVTLAGTNPNFQAVAGTNEFACREYLAGEPAADPLPANRADQTVWHYFVAPPSGAVEMNLRAYIGMNQLRYSIYELLNGTDCYGGLQPATFTENGTKTTPIITPLLQGLAGFTGTQESLCCLEPGKIYAVQLDGGSPGDEGEYIIEYIKEIASDAGDIYVEMTNGSIFNVTQPDTAFVCYNDTIHPGIMLNGIGQSTLEIPSCLQLGYVIHSTNPIPSPVANTGFNFIDSVQTQNGVFVNNSNGSGSFGNPLYNQLYYISPMADQPSNWGDLTCISSTVGTGLPIVFLQPIVPTSNYNNSNCEITFTCSGGLAGFYGNNFSYSISNAAGNIVEVGTFAPSQNVVFSVPSAEVFTISVTDGACPYSFTVDASACSNPCIVSPNLNFVTTTLCNGESIYLEGANQTTAGLYTDVFTAANGCDSTVYTTVNLIEPVTFAQSFTICQGSTITVGSSTYGTSGIYTDVLTAANGCDSTITTTLFVESTLTSNYSQTICFGDTYLFGGNNLSTSGIYTTTMSATGGCDSVITLFLTVRPMAMSSLNATICFGQTYSFGGQNYAASGTYSQTLTTTNGCDSVITLNLTVLPIINGSTSATICQGQSYNFGSQVLTASGTYSQQFTTASGCDSIATLYLFVENQLTSNIDTTICVGESYILGSQTITETGVYEELFTTSAGCDSLVHLEISVNDCSGPFEISNIVTPNEDGQNDTWKINHYEQIAGCTVTIFNRWGQPVYETTDYHNEWGGTKDGEILPDGVYYYAIKCSSEEYKGSLNLFRLKK
jgi:gliding motility-associated-like protein